jgi:hypothetical protein
MTKVSMLGLAAGILVALGVAAPAAALRLEGLGPLRTVQKEAASVQVNAGSLDIALKDGALHIHSWPTFLPREFKQQRVSAARFLHPAGPTDRVELSELADHADPEPWLIVFAAARPAQTVLGPWSLRHGSRGWALASGSTLLRLHLAGPGTRVRAEGARWCVYALSEEPAAKPGTGLAVESEARLDLVAWRQTVTNPQCKREETAK